MLIYGLLLALFAYETLPKQVAFPQKTNMLLGGYHQVLSDRQSLSFTGAFILAQMCATMIWIPMSVYANGIYCVPESQYGFIPTTNTLLVVFLQLFITQITKRHRPLFVMMIGTLFYALGVGSVALGHSFIGFWVSIEIMTVGELILMPTASAYAASLAPQEMRGRYMSIIVLTWSATAGIAPILGGYLNDNFAPVATWYRGFVIGVIGIFWFFIISRRQAQVQSSVLVE
jgi:MFS family permease